MTFSNRAIPDTPREAAAWWFARVHSGAMSRQDHLELARWRQASPDNEREFQVVQALGDAAARLHKERVRELLGGPIPVRPALRRRQMLRAGLAATCTVAAAAGVGLYWREPAAAYAATLSTRKGERRQAALPDGSVLELNTDTQATVSLYERRRVVELTHGEIMFSVSPDAARPFVVKTSAGQVRVVGTRFDVRRDGRDMAVAVESGIVEVSSGRWWDRATQRLTAGLGMRVDQDGASPVRRVDVAGLTAWRSGRLVFDNALLADMVQEINRYLQRPIRVADPGLDSLRVTASFRLDDPEALTQSLPKILPVTVRIAADGAPLIEAR